MIPVNRPVFEGNEKRYLNECIDSGWISSEGRFVRLFETQFAEFMGCQYGIAVCNGSMAIDLALAALKIGPGDEVIMPSFTIISCAAAVVRAGAIPVLIDCIEDTWNIDPALIAAKVTDRTRAILAVHIYGLPVDIDPVLQLARRHGIFVIEDAAEQHGQTYKGHPVGSLGDIATVSFYPNKLITTGEGGMLITNNAVLADRCRELRNLCFDAERRYIHQELGWNLRMSNLQAAVGLAQLEQVHRVLHKKRLIGGWYQDCLRGNPSLQLPISQTDYASNLYWVFGVVLTDRVPFDAREAISRLRAEGVDARHFFWPMHEQPALRKLGFFSEERYPNSERIARRGFFLPSGVGTTQEEVHKSAEALTRILR